MAMHPGSALERRNVADNISGGGFSFFDGGRRVFALDAGVG